MIVLTVKTLDSQNHTFTVEDNITVEEFKTKIADTVNIPADTQRIIYCGRVLQDSAKLSDYDVNGKVVHLVQRAPPSQNPPTTRSASPQPQRRGFRPFEGGNTMYLGSMAFPSNLMESQGIIPPPPTHSLAGSRLNVARRMLRRADAVISLLENPTARPSDQPTAEEQQEEEVTPIIEARVIVPPGNNETIDEAMVLSAVQNSLFDAASGSIPIGGEVSVDGSGGSQSGTDGGTAEHSASSTPEEGATPPSTATESSSEQRTSGGVNARSLAENASRTSEMAELLSMLNQLQTRFAPFLERYRHFMVEDPIIPSESVRQTQAMLTRVSEVLHFLGHAYHSLSDIIIRVRTPPPRPLLCRPILIQHSAVVQAGIPIQVEVAQFHLSADGNNATSASTTSTTNSDTTTTSTTAEASTSTTSANTSGQQQQPQQQPTLNIRGLPFIPGASMRVQSFPIELRAGRPIGVVNSNQRSQNNNNNTVGSGTPAAAAAAAAASGSNNSTNSGGSTDQAAPNNAGGTNENPNARPFGNSSVEFFMEVTPEVIQNSLNGSTPDILNSIIQMASRIIDHATTSTASTETPASSTTSTTDSSASQSSTAAASAAPTASGQNSQARVNTQTHLTTSTSTRSTPRPHVHLAQQAMQGGFDPFLPCNSHHVTHRRRGQQSSRQQQQQSQSGDSQPAPQSDSSQQRRTGMPMHPLADLGTVRDAWIRRFEMEGQRRRQDAPAGARPQTNTTNGANANLTAGHVTNLLGAAASLQGMASLNRFAGPTIAEILQQLPSDEQIRPGESIITDLIMLLSRNFTIVDMITLNSGNLEPLNRVTGDINSFFNTQILEGSRGPEAVNRGVEKFMTEMRAFFQNFNRLPTRDNIDIVRSVELLFRRRLPEIITTAANLRSDNVRALVNQCTNLAKMLCALALHVSATGNVGVEETFQQMINSYMQGIPPELQNWTSMTSCGHLRHFMRNLGVGVSEIEEYVVRNTDVPMATSPAQSSQSEARGAHSQESEPMELDEPIAVADNADIAAPLSISGDESEPLPNIMLGSEAWHGQVPEDWVPIIARDVQRQRRQSPQTPFSDAYLSGMPTKRRKIVNSTKPQGSLPQVIAESVRRAVTATGLASAAPLETVAQGAGDSAEVQNAYRSLLRTTVQTALRDNEDFTPERFPNASTYFKPQ